MLLFAQIPRMHFLISNFTRASVCFNPRLSIFRNIGISATNETTKICAQKPKKPKKPQNPFCLQPLPDDGHTVRRHNNVRRQNLYEFGLYVAACMPKYVQRIQMQHNDQLEIMVAPDGIFQVASFLCNHQHALFAICSSATAVDVPSREYRFEVVYNILSLRFVERCRIKTYTDELTPLHSLNELWNNCNWLEREIYDMFGVIFSHHPDLRRILTDYGFKGHPLRKDFPVIGYTEVRFDDGLKKIVYEPVEYAQEMRTFNLETPWSYFNNFHEGYGSPKPKDDKITT